MKVLELGCGFNKTPGATGVDVIQGSHADIIHDLDKFPYPFTDDEWDRILCRCVLEHVNDFVGTVNEIWRIARPGAMVEVVGPFMSSVNYYADPTHKRAFTSKTFDYFIEGRLASNFGYSKARFDLVACEYDREERLKRTGVHRWLLDWANRNKQQYEARFAFIYPLYQMFFDLKVIK
ncbi:MAG TPA: class I SAM-dependent methyltransferase [Burkholderiaceae bacterium]|nr:class I SAM-dependent methyltransferase [Burkholderiaceae bacterium]